MEGVDGGGEEGRKVACYDGNGGGLGDGLDGLVVGTSSDKNIASKQGTYIYFKLTEGGYNCISYQ